MGNPSRCFTCLWSKDAAAKKKKRWSDGYLRYDGGTAVEVRNADGDKVASWKLKQSEVADTLIEDTEVLMGGTTVQLMQEQEAEAKDELENNAPNAAAALQRQSIHNTNRSSSGTRGSLPPPKPFKQLRPASRAPLSASTGGFVAPRPKPGFNAPRMTPQAAAAGAKRRRPEGCQAGTTVQKPKKTAAAAAPAVPAAYTPAYVDPDDLVLEWSGEEGREQPIRVGVSLARRLHAHQKHGVKFLWRCLTGKGGHARGHGAILADEMGLGKTCTAITMMDALLKHCHEVKKVVIVCPSSLVRNWGNEVSKWCGSTLSQCTHVVERGGPAATGIANDFKIGSSQRFRILIISYELYRMHAAVINAAQGLGLLICDEGHRLKSQTGSKTMQALMACPARRRLLLTGTPVQNNLEEFFMLADFTNPGVLGTAAEFKTRFSKPIGDGQDKQADKETALLAATRASQLKEVMDTFVLRRTKEVALGALPPKHELTVFCRPSEAQADLIQNSPMHMLIQAGRTLLYLALALPAPSPPLPFPPFTLPMLFRCLSSSYVQTLLASRQGSIGALPLICCIRKLINHPDLVKDMAAVYERMEGHDEDSEDDEASDTPVSPGATPAALDSQLSGKLVAVEHLLDAIRIAAPTDRVCLASNFTSTLTLLEALALRRGWSYLRLDGSTPAHKRQSLVDRFNAGPGSSYDPPFLFLLSAKAGGVGLNLVGANRLVLFDSDFNPAICSQTCARVWRFGQTKEVTIYRLILTGSMEEVIYQRQLFKGQLYSVMDGESGSSTAAQEKKSSGGAKGRFSLSELKELFVLKTSTDCDTFDKMSTQESGEAACAWEAYAGPESLSDAPLKLAISQHQELAQVISFVHTEHRG
ncbi:unnamed protein product [Chrysoparadoxa australica]